MGEALGKKNQVGNLAVGKKCMTCGVRQEGLFSQNLGVVLKKKRSKQPGRGRGKNNRKSRAF